MNEATTFAKLGYVGASINYRLYPSGCTTNYQLATCVQEMTDAQHDAQAAVRFLRANAATYGVDPTRIATTAELTTYLTSFDGAGHAPYTDHGTEMFEQTRNFLYWEMDLPAAAH